MLNKHPLMKNVFSTKQAKLFLLDIRTQFKKPKQLCITNFTEDVYILTALEKKSKSNEKHFVKNLTHLG